MPGYRQKLHDAVATGNLEQARSLLDLGYDPNKPYMASKFPVLFIACKQQDLQMVKLLISHEKCPADPNKLRSNGYYEYDKSPIFYAVHKNNIAMAKLLLTESVIKVKHTKEYDGHTLLMEAVLLHGKDMVKLLLDTGSDDAINHTSATKYGLMTPLMAVVFTNKLDVVDLLYDHEADVNVTTLQNSHYNSVLHIAIQCHSLDFVKCLIQRYKADVFVGDGTAVPWAVEKNKPECLEFLLQHSQCLVQRRRDADFVVRKMAKIGVVDKCKAEHRKNLSKNVRPQTLRGDKIWWYGSMLHASAKAKLEDCARVLLFWGVNNVPYNKAPKEVYRKDPAFSVFFEFARHGCWKIVMLLKLMYP